MSQEVDELLGMKTSKSVSEVVGGKRVSAYVMMHHDKSDRWRVSASIEENDKTYYFVDEPEAEKFIDEFFEAARKKLGNKS